MSIRNTEGREDATPGDQGASDGSDPTHAAKRPQVHLSRGHEPEPACADDTEAPRRPHRRAPHAPRMQLDTGGTLWQERRSPRRSRPLPHPETRRAHKGSHELRPGPRPGGETMTSTVLECSVPKAVPRHRTDPKRHPSPGGRVQAVHCLFWWHKRPAPAPAPTAGGELVILSNI